MKDGYGCFGKPQEQKKPIDEIFAEARARGSGNGKRCYGRLDSEGRETWREYP